MVPSSRGSAGVAAIVLAAAVLLVAVWLVTGLRNAKLDRAIDVLGEAGDPGVTGPEARAFLGRADALSKRLDRQVGTVPEDVRLVRAAAGGGPPPPHVSPPGVDDLEGTVDGSSILLTWRAAGDEPATGYRVERLDASGEVIATTEVGPEAREYRDGPVNAIRGRRIYRVSALGRDRAVVDLQQKTVPFRMGFTVDFLGALEDGTARFRVSWTRAGQRISESFVVAEGGEIGGTVPGTEDRPELDCRTGWRFAGFAGRRRIETLEASVPRFTATGTLERDPETGKAVSVVRKMPVVVVEEGAEVELPRDDGATGRQWLKKAEDG